MLLSPMRNINYSRIFWWILKKQPKGRISVSVGYKICVRNMAIERKKIRGQSEKFKIRNLK